MSYIHDALKRSQAQRQQLKSGPANKSSHAVGAVLSARKKKGNSLVFATLFLVTGLTAGIFYSSHKPAPVTVKKEDRNTKIPVVKAPAAQIKKTQLRAPPGNTAYADLPYLWELPAGLKQELGSLSVNIHVYADNPGQRFLYLNNREYRAGEQTPDGVRVVRIEPQGAVLSYAEQLFRLPRPR